MLLADKEYSDRMFETLDRVESLIERGLTGEDAAEIILNETRQVASDPAPTAPITVAPMREGPSVISIIEEMLTPSFYRRMHKPVNGGLLPTTLAALRINPSFLDDIDFSQTCANLEGFMFSLQLAYGVLAKADEMIGGQTVRDFMIAEMGNTDTFGSTLESIFQLRPFEDFDSVMSYACAAHWVPESRKEATVYRWSKLGWNTNIRKMKPTAEAFFEAHKDELMPIVLRYRATLLIDYSEEGFINKADVRRCAAMKAHEIFPVLERLLPAWEAFVALATE